MFNSQYARPIKHVRSSIADILDLTPADLERFYDFSTGERPMYNFYDDGEDDEDDEDKPTKFDNEDFNDNADLVEKLRNNFKTESSVTRAIYKLINEFTKKNLSEKDLEEAIKKGEAAKEAGEADNYEPDFDGSGEEEGEDSGDTKDSKDSKDSKKELDGKAKEGKVKKGPLKKEDAGIDKANKQNSRDWAKEDLDITKPANWPTSLSSAAKLDTREIEKFKANIKNFKGIHAIKGNDLFEEDNNGAYIQYRKAVSVAECIPYFIRDTRHKALKLKSLARLDYTVAIPCRKIKIPTNVILFIDDSGSMCHESRLEKTCAIIEYFIEKYKKGEIDLVINFFLYDVRATIWIKDLVDKLGGTSGLLNAIKNIFKVPGGGGTNISNAIDDFLKNTLPKKVKQDAYYAKFFPSDETKVVAINDGDDSCVTKAPCVTHGIAYEENSSIKKLCVDSGGTYNIF